MPFDGNSIGVLEDTPQAIGDLPGKKGGHRITHLHVLGATRPLEEIVVRECLEAGCFAHRQAPALPWIWMDIVVAVLREVTSDRAGRMVLDLYPEAVVEFS